MQNSSLPQDDRAPQQLGAADLLLRRQLDDSLARYFMQQCDAANRQLLATFNWSIATTSNVPTLTIVCANQCASWQVLNRAVSLGETLARFSRDAKLRIYATPELLEAFDIRVDELSVYRE